MTASIDCLCINAGSSSLKLTLYRVGPNASEQRIKAGAALEIGRPEAGIEIDGHIETQPLENHVSALEALLELMELPHVDAVGHRVVHGGAHSRQRWLTPLLLTQLEAIIPLAPLHIPPALACMTAISDHLPGIPQVACFDTAFHAELPELARTLPLPLRYRESGVYRYGFHGLSYEYVVRKLGARAKGRVIVAHLGNGASLAAILDGRSMDTTMGLTPSGGVIMGTRSGDLDPGVLFYLMREEGLDTIGLQRLIDRESGLLGVSGISADMATLLGQQNSAHACLAVDLFAYQVRKAIGALATVLGGVDRLVFTGGIGEHAASVRLAICTSLEFLGIELDRAANSKHASVISAAGTRCCVEVIPTDEDAMIAHHVFELLHAAPKIQFPS